MKKILWLLILCISSVCNASVIDDGYLSKGEYIGQGRVYNSDTLIVNGGNAHQILMSNDSHLEVLSTSLPLSNTLNYGVYSIDIWDSSSLHFSGGATSNIHISDDATALIDGGFVGTIFSSQIVSIDEYGNYSTHITIDCQDDWEWIKDSGDNIVGISGTWWDNTSFMIDFQNSNNYEPTYMNIEVIPEPCSLALLGIGSMFLKRRN